MARIPYADPAVLAPDVLEALDTLPDLNIFRMLAHAQTALSSYLRFGSAVLVELELDAGLREIAILQAAKTAECEYEWVQHVVIAQHAGVSEEQIGAIQRGDITDDCLSETQRAVVRFADEVVRRPRPSDDTFALLTAQLPPRQIVELLLAIGNYLMLARLLTALDVELDDAAGSAVGD